jgi:hypothetical protein
MSPSSTTSLGFTSLAAHDVGAVATLRHAPFRQTWDDDKPAHSRSVLQPTSQYPGVACPHESALGALAQVAEAKRAQVAASEQGSVQT